jgi:hypothetical protein
MEVELWRDCGPEFVIEGTQGTYVGRGDASTELVRFEFPGGVDLGETDEVLVAWRFDQYSTGPIIAGEAVIGWTDDTFAVWEGDQCGWYWFGGMPYAGFSASISCLGAIPYGACCDGTICYESQQINCAGPNKRWLPDVPCEPDPFDPPCGAYACCLPDPPPEGLCENLTQAACESAGGGWQAGEFCGEGGQDCGIFACHAATGDCMVAHDGIGCGNYECCNEVCGFDSWCCTHEWDGACVRWAEAFCGQPPLNDACWDADPEAGAMDVSANSVTVISNENATDGADDPGFCCHPTRAGDRGHQTVWFTFEATETSARIHTCDSLASADDSLVAVYAAGDPSTPESACNSLIEIACAESTPGCGDGEFSDLCVAGLELGEVYHIQLASESAYRGGVYSLTLESPCPDYGPAPACPPGVITWLGPPDGVVDARRPHEPDDPDSLQGIDTLVFQGPDGSGSPCCLALCETADNGVPNQIYRVTPDGDAFNVRLNRPITAGAVTTLTYRSYDGTETTASFTSHPANVNADSYAAPTDILALLDRLNNVRPVPWGLYSCDLDHSGVCDQVDILCLIDLLNGAAALTAWNETPLPQTSGICP